MFEDVLARIRTLFRQTAYIVTLHADEEMANDGLYLPDIEHVLMTGQIIGRQHDVHTAIWKYLIQGYTRDDIDVVIVAKISPVDMLIIVTDCGEFMTDQSSEGSRLCAHCGSPHARLRYLSRSYGTGADLLVIEHVPVISCPSCGESYMTAQTMLELDHIRRQRQQRATTRPVAVAAFGK